MKCGLAVFVALAVGATTAGAQVQGSAQGDDSAKVVDAEMRLDGIISRVSAVQLGAGVMMPAGYYVRVVADAALGFSRHGLSGRIDGLARFHFDPFRQSRWAPYGGGGISGRFDKGEKARAYLLIFLGMDGPVTGGLTPSFELGLGGGVRVGVTIRHARKDRR